MKTIKLDAKCFSNWGEFLDYAADMFVKDPTWGPLTGMDALDDVLEGGFGVFSEGDHVKVVWEDSRKSMSDLNVEETMIYYIDILGGAHKSARADIKKEMEAVEAARGKTLFLLIVETFVLAENVILELR